MIWLAPTNTEITEFADKTADKNSKARFALALK